MNLESLVKMAKRRGASDVHVEPRLPVAVRIRGTLESWGPPITAAESLEMARQLLRGDRWDQFVRRHSFDIGLTIAGVRCRTNVFEASRGVSLAVRVLPAAMPTIERLNLLPDLGDLVKHRHGLVLVSGATGSGKSSTLAALINEINVAETRHVLTIEDPIEYSFRPRKSYIRQREVGRHTPSFEQALLDALRENPDVVMVGEMRHPEVMRLTLNMAETGHLVFATVHSSNTSEALARVISAFAPEIQTGVASQLADCLIAVIAQHLPYRPALKMVVPECEILMATPAVRNLIRQQQLFKIPSTLTTSARDGMWTFERYRAWLESKTNWYFHGEGEEEVDLGIEADPESEPLALSTASPVAEPPALESISPGSRPLAAGRGEDRVIDLDIGEALGEDPLSEFRNAHSGG